MNEYNLLPFKGIGKISFGMNRHECRLLLNSNFRTFKRNDFAKNTTDYFPDLNFFIEFDENDICQAIEFSSYNYLIYEGRNLFDFNFAELINYYNLFSQNNEIEEDESVTFFDLGFGASKAAENDNIESIIVFSDKYW